MGSRKESPRERLNLTLLPSVLPAVLSWRLGAPVRPVPFDEWSPTAQAGTPTWFTQGWLRKEVVLNSALTVSPLFLCLSQIPDILYLLLPVPANNLHVPTRRI